MTLITRVILPNAVYVIGDSQINDRDSIPISINGKRAFTEKVIYIPTKNVVFGIAGSLGTGGTPLNGQVKYSNTEILKQYLRISTLSIDQVVSEIPNNINTGSLNVQGDIILLISYFEKGVIKNKTLVKLGTQLMVVDPYIVNSVSLSCISKIKQFLDSDINYNKFEADFIASNLLAEVEFNFNYLHYCNWYNDPNLHRPDILYTILFLVMQHHGYKSLTSLNDGQIIELMKEFYKAINDISWYVYLNGDPQLRTIGECAFIYKLEPPASVQALHQDPLFTAQRLSYFIYP